MNNDLCNVPVPSGKRLLEYCMSGSMTVTTWTEDADAMVSNDVSLK